MSSKYNLRQRTSPSESEKGSKSSPYTSKPNPKSPNASGYSSSHSYRDKSLKDDSDQYTDSQDERDYSYPSTAFSYSAATPSPKLPKGRKGAGSSGSDTSHTPSSFSHQSPVSSPESKNSPKKSSRIYPDLSSEQFQSNSGIKEKPPSPRKNVKTDPTKSNQFNNTCLTVGVGLAIFLLIVLCFSSSKESEPQKQQKSFAFKKFASEVDNLQPIFKSQESRTWRSIKSSVKHILNGTDPEYPAVVLFAVNKEIDVVASCLARRVASLFNSITAQISDDGYFDARLMTHLEPGKQKENLDEKIHSQLKTGRSVVIDHLEALSPKASLLLHGTCDNDNAPWKDVFIGIVFYVDKNLKPTDVDSELTRYFKTGLDMDKIGALLTRINNNPVVITEENEFNSQLCELDQF